LPEITKPSTSAVSYTSHTLNSYFDDYQSQFETNSRYESATQLSTYSRSKLGGSLLRSRKNSNCSDI